MQLVSRGVRPQNVGFVHVVRVCFGSSRMVGWKSKTVKVICSSDDWIAGNVILVNGRCEDRLDELPCDTDWMIWLHVESPIEQTDDTW